MARRARRSSTRDSVILVKVARTGGTVTEVALNGDTGHSVEAALEAAGFDVDEGQRIRVNGRQADLDKELHDGDVVTLAGSIKGGL